MGLHGNSTGIDGTFTQGAVQVKDNVSRIVASMVQN